MGMFLPNAQISGTGKDQMTKQPHSLKEDSPLFQMLLAKLQLTNEDSSDTAALGNQENVESIIYDAQLPIHLQTVLKDLIRQNQIGSRENNSTEQEEVMLIVENLFPSQTISQDLPLALSKMPASLDNEKVMKQLADLFTKAQHLLNQVTSAVTNQKQMKETAPDLLQILKEWTALSKKTGTNQQNVTQVQSMIVKESPIFEELVQNFVKRNQLVTKHQYNSAAEVTTNDVAKWMKRAIENHGLAEKTNVHTITPTSMPMSKVEQFIIHLNQAQNSQSNGQQLMEQFQRLIKSSKFMSTPNGTNQMNITLRPGNMGEMVVKLTQINGEMTVKILVSSQAAKEMLDSNMHQLRHMFSPQQVVVEKQEINLQHAQTLQKDTTDQHSDNQQNSQQSQQDGENNHEDDFAMTFEEALLNEKV
ncbi:flagellar hook-length control protein FliK [Virgibacillus sp. SK37]|uniref:flagellar hook-length control protein FliK n=1 Tax=Virgibacillus sp. SK37 TaxID=403957 RepID=UPI000A81CE6E|nr:flagellar hook-length control protein FliK [Virgibacillus sp. SK37]